MTVAVATSAKEYPIPVTPPPRTLTSTSVVSLHSMVPSASGVSVGTVKAETSSDSTGGVESGPTTRIDRQSPRHSGKRAPAGTVLTNRGGNGLAGYLRLPRRTFFRRI